jgi:hypothetical protein
MFFAIVVSCVALVLLGWHIGYWHGHTVAHRSWKRVVDAKGRGLKPYVLHDE